MPSARLKVLSQARQIQLQLYWNEKLKDPRAFVPVAKLKELDLTEIRKGKELFGKFASDYMCWVIGLISKDSDIARRRTANKKILAVGYGYGHDYKRWPRKSVKLGLQTWCVDVSSSVWIWAHTNLSNQYKVMRHTDATLKLEPRVVTSEIQSLLADPHPHGLDVSSIEVCYLCRLLNCLSTSSAKIVLQELGRIMFSSVSETAERNAVVVINALSNDNKICTCAGRTSIVRSKEMILANLRRGAGRSVEARFLKYYDYFGKKVTAMTIMLKS